MDILRGSITCKVVPHDKLTAGQERRKSSMIKSSRLASAVPEIEHNDYDSKENSLSKRRNKKFICFNARLLALFSKKLRGLKYGL